MEKCTDVVYPWNLIIDVCGVENISRGQSISQRIMNEIDGMDGNDIDILVRRYYHGETLAAIGEAYGVTRERIRQRISSDLRKVALSVTQMQAAEVAEDERAEEAPAQPCAMSDVLLADTSLSHRARNALRRAGIHTVGELVSRSEDELMGIRGFGEKCLESVEALMREMRRGSAV